MAFEMAGFDFFKSKCSPTEGYPSQPWILFFMFRCYEIRIPVGVFQIPAVIGFQFLRDFEVRIFCTVSEFPYDDRCFASFVFRLRT